MKAVALQAGPAHLATSETGHLTTPNEHFNPANEF